MNQDILNPATLMQNSDEPKVKLEDLAEYAKNNCKKCYGRGWNKKVRCLGSKKWVLDHYDICKCVLRSKRLPELWEKVKEAAEKGKAQITSSTTAELEESAEVMKEALDTPVIEKE